MKKFFLSLFLMVGCIVASAQVPGDTAALRTAINSWVVTNGAKAITATQINQLFNGIANLMKSNAVDSLYRINDTLFCRRKGYPTIKVTLSAGGAPSETDPTVPSVAKALTTADTSRWNGKQDAFTVNPPFTLDGGVLGIANTEAIWNARELQGFSVSTTIPTTGYVLKWNGLQWVPAAESGGSPSVSHDLTLTGAGTSLNPLKVDTTILQTAQTGRDSIARLRAEIVTKSSSDSVAWRLDGSNNLVPKPFAGSRVQITNKLFILDGTTGTAPNLGSGTRLMWLPAKSAFRAGFVSGSQWDNANVGLSSIAMGNSPIASATNSIAFGNGSVASGIGSLAIAGGWAGGSNSVAIGGSDSAQHSNVISIGQGSKSVYPNSTIIGYNLIGAAAGQFVAGQYNDTTGHSDDVFVVGSGIGIDARRTALWVKFDKRLFLDSIGTGDNTDSVMVWNAASKEVKKRPASAFGSNTLINEGAGFRPVLPNLHLRTWFPGWGTALDSTTHANSLTVSVDSSAVASLNALKDSSAALRSAIAAGGGGGVSEGDVADQIADSLEANTVYFVNRSTGKGIWLKQISVDTIGFKGLKAGWGMQIDSTTTEVEVKADSSALASLYALKDSARILRALIAAGGGSGVTTVGTFSGSGQTNGAGISGSTITFGPATTSLPGMVTTGNQNWAGLKNSSGGFSVSGNSGYGIQDQNDGKNWLMYLNSRNLVFNAQQGDFSYRDVMTFKMDAPANSLLLNSAGRFAIGTTTPLNKLHVVGSTRTDSLKLGMRIGGNVGDSVLVIGSDSLVKKAKPVPAQIHDSLSRITSGSYTPTLTNASNISSSTANTCYYMRIGDIVTVTGSVSLDPTTINTQTHLGISLPIASAFTDATDAAGPISFPSTDNVLFPVGVFGDATNDRADLQFTAPGTDPFTVYFTFTYIIKVP